jgi:hypothetical protein
MSEHPVLLVEIKAKHRRKMTARYDAIISWLRCTQCPHSYEFTVTHYAWGPEETGTEFRCTECGTPVLRSRFRRVLKDGERHFEPIPWNNTGRALAGAKRELAETEEDQ